MSKMARCGSALVISLVLLAFVCVSGLITTKAFFCRDPDTGKLHPVNSTWYATSFCGKYTCKLRKKEGNDPPIPPTPVENVKEKCPHSTMNENTKNKETDDAKANKTKNVELAASAVDGDRYLTDQEITALAMILQYVKKSDLEAILDVYNLAQDIYKDLDKYDMNLSSNDTIEDKLNKTPTTPKKSYWYDPLAAPASNKIKEAAEVMEVKPGQASLPHTINPANSPNTYPKENEMVLHNSPKITMEQREFFEGPLARNYLRMLPYYHPLSDFQKISAFTRSTEVATKLETMTPSPILAPPAIYPLAPMYPSLSYIQLPPLPSKFLNQQNEMHQVYSQQQKNQAEQQAKLSPKLSYIQLPPLSSMYSNQQNQMQQVNSQQQKNQAEPQAKLSPNIKKSDNQQTHEKRKNDKQRYEFAPWVELSKKTTVSKLDNITYSATNNTNGTKDALSIGESKLMAGNHEDFPHVYLQNDTSSSKYNGKNMWHMLKLDSELQKPLTRAEYVGHISPVDASDAGGIADPKEDVQFQFIEESTEFHDLLISNEMPAWQTAPLSDTVLNGIKANIVTTKFLPYPFRKKIPLEKVEKNMKMEPVIRTRREVIEDLEKLQGLYEVYIENATCLTDTEPGFFRMGNASEPFPHCCPQRIQS